jgi:hypothetical protein
MTLSLEWLDRLNRDSKGIWGVSSQKNSLRGGNCVDQSSPTNCEVENVYIVNIEGVTRFQCSEKTLQDMNLKFFTDKAGEYAEEFQRSFVRIVIHDFHIARVEEQCLLIKESRAIQEASTKTAFQFVFCGQWSYFSFCKSYYELHGKTSSPAAEYKNILYAPYITLKEVRALLLQESLISSQITEIEQVACEFLIESTSGNEFLTYKAIEYIKDKGGCLVDSVEEVIDELIVAPEIINYVKDGVNFLGEESRKELVKLLKVHRLIRKKDSATTECLWLSGLVKYNNVSGNKYQIQIAGPIINTILRNIAISVDLKVCAPASYLCLENHVISSQAYRKVAEIENLFRCLIVSDWYEKYGESWSDKLQEAKTPAHCKSESEELINLVLKCIKEEFPQLKAAEPIEEVQEYAKNVKPKRKPKHEGILDSARDWQSRQHDHYGVELGKSNEMHFLTTESLKSVFTYKNSGMFGEGNMFPQKDLLFTLLDEYLVIRSAVAHNQPLMLVTLSRLDELLRKITDLISVFSDKECLIK